MQLKQNIFHLSSPLPRITSFPCSEHTGWFGHFSFKLQCKWTVLELSLPGKSSSEVQLLIQLETITVCIC